MIFRKPWVVHIYVSLLHGILQVFQDLGGRDDGWDDRWDDVMALWIFSLALINDSGGEFMMAMDNSPFSSMIFPARNLHGAGMPARQPRLIFHRFASFHVMKFTTLCHVVAISGSFPSLVNCCTIDWPGSRRRVRMSLKYLEYCFSF